MLHFCSATSRTCFVHRCPDTVHSRAESSDQDGAFRCHRLCHIRHLVYVVASMSTCVHTLQRAVVGQEARCSVGDGGREGGAGEREAGGGQAGGDLPGAAPGGPPAAVLPGSPAGSASFLRRPGAGQPALPLQATPGQALVSLALPAALHPAAPPALTSAGQWAAGQHPP